MGFNNGRERRKFETEWKKLRVEYAAAGMDEAAIEEMYQFDLGTFNSERRYAEHTQAMPSQQFEDDGDTASEENSALLVKFLSSFAVMPKDTDSERRDSWMDEIGSEDLSAALRRLSEEDIELLTLYVFEERSVTEIAELKGIAHQNVSKKIRRIKKFLKDF
ncbi:MAG: hypothetical protein ENTB_04226 [Enterocloster aldenensis]